MREFHNGERTTLKRFIKVALSERISSNTNYKNAMKRAREKEKDQCNLVDYQDVTKEKNIIIYMYYICYNLVTYIYL